MKRDLITIGVALHNNANTIRVCLDSILNQDYVDIEVIVVDDGSTDQSLTIVQMYSDARIRVIEQQNNGLSSVRQLCLDNSRGRFICFVDADDYLLPHYISKLYDSISSNSSDIAICGTSFLFETGEESVDYGNTYFNVICRNHKVTKSELINNYCKLLNEYLMSDSWNKMYRVDFLKKTDVRFVLPKKMNGSDLAFNHKLMLHEPCFSVVSEPLYVHVLYSRSATHRKGKKLSDSMLVIMGQIVEESKKLLLFPSLKQQLSGLFYLLIRNAIQDMYNENREAFPVFKEELEKVYSSIAIFKNDFFKPKSSSFLSLSLFLFAILLDLNSTKMIYLYCKARNRYENKT